MPLSDEMRLTEVVEMLDFVRVCIRCHKNVGNEELSVVLTPWTITSGDAVRCIGMYVVFLCWKCREGNASVAQDILTTQNATDSVVVDDADAFK